VEVLADSFNYLAVLEHPELVRPLTPDLASIARMDRDRMIVTAPRDDRTIASAATSHLPEYPKAHVPLVPVHSASHPLNFLFMQSGLRRLRPDVISPRRNVIRRQRVSEYKSGARKQGSATQAVPLTLCMQHGDSTAFDQTLEHFRARGFMRVPGAFSRHEAEAMRAAVWRVLERSNIREDRPSTWTTERPTHLQELKDDPTFGAPWGPRTRAAIGQILESASWPDPRSWGAFFITFPSAREWNVPSSVWHTDARYTSALAPPEGIRLHALMGDVEPRSGATAFLAGSHKLLHQWFKHHPPQPGARGSDHRKALMGHPYIRDLHKEAGPEERIARFMERAEEHDGVELQVVENTGAAGDVILAHPLLLHAASVNAGSAPRFLLSGAVDFDSMWAPRYE
jgi:hypothetical protein